jgi:hypothetical protein
MLNAASKHTKQHPAAAHVACCMLALLGRQPKRSTAADFVTNETFGLHTIRSDSMQDHASMHKNLGQSTSP